ncbi:MAG: undecaprenyldiphospho-muramoylpentapeptide beta-N-acetylglucosaminyltransferase [Oscillospiraceae bacterium]|nr:undecaprenyldiphospho-muramoylpentapeptide beta-N-acetylglucosaminyltransferase [Oscillospiraceae bacterium]
MRILFACGGTGGHINPAIAVASYIRERHPDAVIQFAGNPQGMEAKLVTKAGFDFAPIIIKGIQRRLTWRNIKYNISSVYYLTTASARSEKLIKAFDPDIVVGTGGYVSGPILRKAAKMGIKTISHESNAFPGVTTKLLARYVNKILLAVPEAKKYLPDTCAYSITGNPVRESIIFADREKARAKFGLADDEICILSFGGSQGARRLNEAMADLLVWEQKQPKIHHIHATGMYGVDVFPALLKDRGLNPDAMPRADIREYINDMDDCLAAADLVIGRSGALTLSELEAAGRASILIPSPNVAENHQYHNAMVLANKNAAVVIEEKDLTGQWMCDTVERLCSDPQQLKALGQNAQSLAILDANQKIYDEIMALLKQ